MREAPRKPEHLFLALLAVVSLQVPLISAETYWAYVPDPPILHPAPWDGPSVRIFVNDTEWFPPSSSDHIEPKTEFGYDYSGQSEQRPICVTVTSNYPYPCLVLGRKVQITEGLTHADSEWFNGHWTLHYTGLGDDAEIAFRQPPSSSKFPPCGFSDWWIPNSLFPKWKDCWFIVPTVHRGPENLTLYDWSLPRPDRDDHYSQVHHPGGWVGTPLMTEQGTMQYELWKMFAAMGPVTLTHGNQSETRTLMVCLSSTFAFLIGYINVHHSDGTYHVNCFNCTLANCLYEEHVGEAVVILQQPSFAMVPVNVSGPWYDHPSIRALEELNYLLTRPKRFIGLLIAGIAALVTIVATAATAAVALSQSIQNAHYVNALSRNVTLALQTQEQIDQKIDAKLNALEEAILVVGNKVSVLQTRIQLRCHAEFHWICVTPKEYNESEIEWDRIRTHLAGIWNNNNLSLDLLALHAEIQSITDATPISTYAADLARQLFSNFHQTFSFMSFRNTLYVLGIVLFVIMIFICLLPVILRAVRNSIKELQLGLLELRLKNKKGGAVGDHLPKAQADKVIDA